MRRMVPVGYLTFREAVGTIEDAMFAGVSDRPSVAKYRQSGDDVANGKANRKATLELWNGVDKGRLKATVIGGRPRRKIKITAEQTMGIPP